MVRLTTRGVRTAWAQWLDHCITGSPFTDVHVWGQTIGGVPTPAVEAVKAWEQAHKATLYTPSSVWAYNMRGIGGAPCSCTNDGRCSLHAYGLAIDVDPRDNPYSWGSPWNGKYTRPQVAAVEGILNVHGDPIWAWGGRWDKPDRMHWQVQQPPIRMQVDWATVPGRKEDDDMAVGPGASGNAVKKIQKGLNSWAKLHRPALEPLVVDGLYGPATQTRVKQYQAAADLEQTGVVDGVTMALLMEYVPDWVDVVPPHDHPVPEHAHPPSSVVPDHGHLPGGVVRE